ncbi:MAG: tRNA uridine-5-carboxymethylaminomethyl(34) synthesis enzyme MnmG [Bacteroidaceae bacterium]|nr:tRNA uridine-5-carboxymethylaminomethyl(34) synthesis enzyme MnmG [Bacteroidaceae bacterium]MBO7167193.1 tRNA uridine-5-carboxymethylaminomethyl(34) synthesis enzyme MnmG [Bacteroidaceae bacterium]
MEYKYDVIVVGAGHAGCEAAAAAAKLGARTCLITMDMNKIAQMSCNPAIGGIAKGQIVREIDALGGHTGEVTDATAIQFRMLNRSKGPAMWSPRAQCDRAKFIWVWREILENTENLSIWQDQVVELLTEETKTSLQKLPNFTAEVAKLHVCGLRTIQGVVFKAPCVVITAGTFLNGLMHIGRTRIPGGRCAELPSLHLSESIAACGITVDRMKTGTPVRIDGRSVDFSLMQRQDGEQDFHKFSYMGEPRMLPQLPCWITYTNEQVHDRLRAALPDSPLYNGQIQSIGPRYCPSIETKLVTFAERTEHQLFLEPEGGSTQEFYLNGFSSSLPIDAQIEALKLIPAFRNLQIYRPGYAIEYDFFDPTQLRHSLESKVVDGLFMAGQVNGTTGYEEAAGQGLVAGINAARKVGGQEPFVMRRDESYIGVLIDDLVTKGVDEPYRMFTSRAEYRILLRQDDADARLTERSYEMGLATRERLDHWLTKKQAIEELESFCAQYSVKAAYVNDGLQALGSEPLQRGCKLIDLVMRPQLTLSNLAPLIPALSAKLNGIADRREEIVEAAEVRMKYSGYIRREKEIADKIQRLENIRIRGRFNYNDIQSLSTEARQKLSRIDPETMAQASRIPGVSPSDINVLLVMMNR